MIMRGREDEGTDMRQRGARGGEAERGKQKARRSRQTQRDRGGEEREGENDCSRLISPHMSPSVQRPGWDGTTALSEMTERAKDTPAPQEAKCNPMNPGLAYYSAESPFKVPFFLADGALLIYFLFHHDLSCS